MKRKIMWIPALLMTLGVLILHCGDDKAGPGDFCEKDIDCRTGLICQNNVCQEKKEGECHPPCTDGETCDQGQCVPIGNPNDKDLDGHDDTVDCNDLNPEIFPGAVEYCDGVDNDCDTQIDEDCIPCTDGAAQDCGTDVGECTLGTQTCVSGSWDVCSGIGPEPESCDGKDNDCDGMTDEVCHCSAGDSIPCSVNQGVCTEGTQICEAGVWTGCSGQLPQQEICDGLDNDCDSLTDEAFNLGFPCTGVGECGDGLLECTDGAPLDPQCDTMPGGSNDASTAEVCDGKDNDCDGLSDEETELNDAPNECLVAKDLGILLDDGASEIKVPGNIWPEGDVDWYRINAKDDLAEDLADNCDRFHFEVIFTQNPGDKLLFDIYVDGCNEIQHMDCQDDTHYERAYDYTEDRQGQMVGQCPCGVDPLAGMTVCADESKVIYIRVHAPTGEATCEEYELTITNGAPP